MSEGGRGTWDWGNVGCDAGMREVLQGLGFTPTFITFVSDSCAALANALRDVTARHVMKYRYRMSVWEAAE